MRPLLFRASSSCAIPKSLKVIYLEFAALARGIVAESDSYRRFDSHFRRPPSTHRRALIDLSDCETGSGLVLYRKRECAPCTHQHGVFAHFRYNDLKEDAGVCGGCGLMARGIQSFSPTCKLLVLRYLENKRA
jgi:hypothetical protein